jgi:hypothetical protein
MQPSRVGQHRPRWSASSDRAAAPAGRRTAATVARSLSFPVARAMDGGEGSYHTARAPTTARGLEATTRTVPLRSAVPLRDDHEEGVDGAAPVDAQNASTSRLENPHTTRVSHTAPRPSRFWTEEEENQRHRPESDPSRNAPRDQQIPHRPTQRRSVRGIVELPES